MAAPVICVLGSCTLDVVLRLRRMPTVGETLFADNAAVLAGGKGLNQAIAAARLGARAAVIGRVGRDALAGPLFAALAREGVDATHVKRDATATTGIAVPIVSADGGNSILAAPGANLTMRVDDVEAAAESIRGAEALLLQFEAPMAVNLRAAAIAGEAGARVILNPAPVREHPQELLSMASVLVVNEVEAAMLAPGARSLEDAARALRGLAREAAVVTLGPAGGLFVGEGGVERFEAFPARVMDTVGAGDAFCGALAVALCEGQPMAAAVRFASAAAAVSVTAAGATAGLPRREQVEAVLSG